MKLEVLYPADVVDYWIATVTEARASWTDPYLIKHPELVQIDEWCERTFGESDCWDADAVTGWKRMYNRYYFSNEKLLHMFVLRWS